MRQGTSVLTSNTTWAVQRPGFQKWQPSLQASCIGNFILRASYRDVKETEKGKEELDYPTHV